MKVARWIDGGQNRYAICVDGSWLDLADALRAVEAEIGTEARAVDDWLARVQTSSRALVECSQLLFSQKRLDPAATVCLDEEQLLKKLEAPVWGDVNIYCAALNYFSHIAECGLRPPGQPLFFVKPTRCVVPPNGLALASRVSSEVDYEAELAVIVGKTGKYLSEEEATDAIFGYTILDDISFRDRQRVPGSVGAMDWLSGKGLDGSAPCGPWMVTSDEIPDPQSLRIQLWVNGELRQDGCTGDMVFSVARLISELSQGITLRPGDVISTGTCRGVASRTGRYLQDGDSVEIAIEGIGRLCHSVVRE